MKIDTLGGLRRFIQSDEVKGLSDDAFFIPYCYNRGSEGIRDLRRLSMEVDEGVIYALGGNKPEKT